MPVKGTPTVDALEELVQLRQDYQALLDQLRWSHAIVSILVEQEGGLVRLDKEIVETYDLGGTIRVREDNEADQYVIEVIPAPLEGEIV